MQIHVIENTHNFSKLREYIWECGWWKLDEDKAKILTGGNIYFHTKRSEPSFYGGSIRGYRVEQDQPRQGRTVFETERGLGRKKLTGRPLREGGRFFSPATFSFFAAGCRLYSSRIP